jgi:hypothetical protein
MRGRQVLGPIAVAVCDGSDDGQVLSVNFFSATGRQAGQSRRHHEPDLIAQALQEALQFDGARSVRNGRVKIDRHDDEVPVSA